MAMGMPYSSKNLFEGYKFSSDDHEQDDAKKNTPPPLDAPTSFKRLQEVSGWRRLERSSWHSVEETMTSSGLLQADDGDDPGHRMDFLHCDGTFLGE